MDNGSSLPVGFEVYSPAGAVETQSLYAPRLDTLEGKTIGELSDGMFESHNTFPRIRELLQARFPTAKIIPWTEFPSGLHTIDHDEIALLLKQRGCDAVIVGNAA